MLQDKLLYATLFSSISLLMKWAVSTFPYSGQNVPPIYGDYEAQRHWQEITVSLPAHQWYINGTDNDLLYWGLDYPPLTAYHSWIIGKIGERVNKSWVELHTSRGTESYQHKLFMRYSVLCSELLVYIPSAILYTFQYTEKVSSNILTALLLYPGLTLIDYGHFQYNCVSLGLFILAVALLDRANVLAASIAFSLALNYKQMELYHAMPFFVYILGSILTANSSLPHKFLKLCVVALVVLSTFALCWAPFLSDIEVAKSVLQRLFPFSRGLFEDKVSNVWCTLNVVYKIRNLLPQPHIVTLCAITTLLSIVPSSLKLFIQPTMRNFKYSLVISSLAFFLFSYQVHEKSILIPVISCLLLIEELPVLCSWFSLISVFSMIPLLLKDGLLIPTLGTTGCFMAVMLATYSHLYTFTDVLQMAVSSIGVLALTICSVLVSPPARYPDLWPVLISVYSCIHFTLFYLHLNYRLLVVKPGK